MENPNIKKPTQTHIKKINRKNKYNIDPVKDLITDAKRQEFGHICDKCYKKRYCHKWKAAIILTCNDFKQKFNKGKPNNKGRTNSSI